MIQECLGCDATSEYKISKMDFKFLDNTSIMKEGAQSQPDIMYALEQSSCIQRTCWKGGRSLSLDVSIGGEKGGTQIFKLDKPCGCPACFIIHGDNGDITIPCCCMLPELQTT